jgi:hypothetical protein
MIGEVKRICKEAAIVETNGIWTLFFVHVPPDVISLQLCTPPKLFVYNSSYL